MKKFDVLVKQTDDDSYFYSNTSYTWFVVSVKTGDEIFSYSGSDNEGRSGSSQRGVQNILIDENEEYLIITDADKGEYKVKLPVDVEFADKGKSIVLIWKNGKREKRKRREAIATTKYGQPFSMNKLKMP